MQITEVREQAIQVSGRRAWQAGEQRAEGSSTSQEKARPMWLERGNGGQAVGNEDREDGSQIARDSEDTGIYPE